MNTTAPRLVPPHPGFACAAPRAQYVAAIRGWRLRVQRWQGEQQPIAREAVEAFRSEMRAPVGASGQPLSPQQIEQRSRLADAMVFPSHHWAFARLLLDDLDHLWVQRYYEANVIGPPSERETSADRLVWDVFDPEGVWVDAVETPAGLVISSIGADHVAGVWRDALGVERVRLHRLHR